MKMMLMAAGALVLSAYAGSAYAEKYPDGHYEDARSTAAEAAAFCLGWPKEAAYMFLLRVHDPESGAETRKWASADDIFGAGTLTVVVVQPYRGLERRACTTRFPTMNDLLYDGTKVTALMRSPEGITGWALKVLDTSHLPADSFEFLVAGPVSIDQ